MSSRYRPVYIILLMAIILVGLFVGGTYWFREHGGDPAVRVMRAVSKFSVEQAPPDKLKINYPLEGSLFPADIVAPTFRWADYLLDTDCWGIVLDFEEGGEPMRFLSDAKEWTPSEEDWATIKKRSQEKPVRVSIFGVQRTAPKLLLSGASVSISTSKDAVDAPIFFREVPLPFIDAVKDPSRIRWRFGSVAKREEPRLLLNGIPSCANCHSFSRDGKVFAMDVDFANDKGSFFISPVEKEIAISQDKIMTWSDYKREDKKSTFGLLAQISPDGQNVLCMVKDRSVFLPTPGIEFSQLFFPICGILVNYNIPTKTFKELPGACDPTYVQANPNWSPDGKEVIFARHTSYELQNLSRTANNDIILSAEDCQEFIQGRETFKFDLYRIPYNDGNGGVAVPIEGASNNGLSNYFARYSPDGKWVVFCRANSFMLLQPDSEIYIMPAAGGEVRRMQCNTNRMNSWHSWSPNSKWLVFTSKVNGPYTQLFLTHIDENGDSTPPVVLSHFIQPQYAANIPEFVNAPDDAIQKLRQEYINDLSLTRVAYTNFEFGDVEKSVALYRKALEMNPQNVTALNSLGALLLEQKKVGEAIEFLEKGLAIAPENSLLHYNYGRTLAACGKIPESIAQYRETVRLDPKITDAWRDLGIALSKQKNLPESEQCFQKVIELDPENADVYYNLGFSQMQQDKLDLAAGNFQQAVKINPKNADAFALLGQIASRQKKYDEAERYYTQALTLQPEHVGYLVEFERILFQKGDYSKAEAQLAKAAKLMPNNATIRYNLGLVLYRQGKTEEGRKEILTAAEADPKFQNTPEPLLMESLYCAGKGDFTKAQALAQEARGIASQAGKPDVVRDIEACLTAYQQGKVPDFGGPANQN
jgi:tetratricopeptide (TPR) repeat protein